MAEPGLHAGPWAAWPTASYVQVTSRSFWFEREEADTAKLPRGETPDGPSRYARSVLQVEGLLARVLQHEIDHLDGILFVTRVEDLTRLWKVSDLNATAAKEVAHI